MQIEQAQADMRHAYLGGATGLMTSALAWLAAALTAFLASPRAAIAALFIGGMCIHPAAMLLSKMLGRPGTHTPGNPLARLAIESTVWLLLSIGIALLASLHRVEWFFIAMLVTIAGRYFTFATLYGLRVFWICGAALALAAFALASLNAESMFIALAGGTLELVFAIVIFTAERSPTHQRA